MIVSSTYCTQNNKIINKQKKVKNTNSEKILRIHLIIISWLIGKNQSNLSNTVWYMYLHFVLDFRRPRIWHNSAGTMDEKMGASQSQCPCEKTHGHGSCKGEGKTNRITNW